jgi:NADH-quinone oxidoreductase subunit N
MLNQIIPVVPVLIVAVAACAVLLAEAFRRQGEWMPVGWLGIIGCVGGILTSVVLWNRDAIGMGVVVLDNYAIFFNVTICAIGLLTILVSWGAAGRDDLPVGEYHALMLFSMTGMMLMGSTNDLLVIFIALEIMSLGVYVMTALKRSSEAGAEAAFKYFVLGAFSSAFFLYGIAMAYAVTGTTKLDELGVRVAGSVLEPNILLVLSMVLLLVGFAFKVSAVPFHMWTPDAYEGAPTLVTGFMSTGIKAAAFAAFVRVFLSTFEPMRLDWLPVVSAIAGLSMLLGTIVGVAQTSVKRMLAYSSIAHAGYLLVGLVAASSSGKAAILFYLVAYAVTTLGTFGVLAALSTPDRQHDHVKDFAGLWRERPGPAVAQWISADRRVRGQVVHLQRRDAGESGRAGRPRCADQCRLGLLLPAHHRPNVYDRGAGARSRAGCSGSGPDRDAVGLGGRVLPRRVAGSIALDRRRFGRVDLLVR